MTDKQLPATTEPSALATLLRDPDRLKDFPVETVERLFAIAKEERAEAARIAYNTAFHALQSDPEFLPVKKLGKNDQTRSLFARAEDVDAMLDPLLARHGFSVSAWREPIPDRPEEDLVVLAVRHAGGHESRHPFPAPSDHLGPKGSPVKTRLHGGASSQTYVVRHLKCNVFNIHLVKDDDGNAGGGGPSAEPVTKEQAANIVALIEEVGADETRFLKYFGLGKVEDLPVGRLREATRMLEGKRRGDPDAGREAEVK